ncbi:MAG: hydroxypyruvate isomerase, partial [Chitinophagaceae bacterium]
MGAQNRRSALKSLVTGGVALTTGQFLLGKMEESDINYKLKGNVNHSVCRWCFPTVSVEELCVAAKGMGIKGIDLVGPKDWPILQKHGLVSA